jgi:hypothetical protein
MKSDEELTALSSERLEREITELGGHINAATARWLGLDGALRGEPPGAPLAGTGGTRGPNGAADPAPTGSHTAAA